MLSQARIAITGGAGFIGSHFAQRLIASGNLVTILDHADLPTSCLAKLGLLNHPSVTCINGSVVDDGIWTQLPKDFDYIVHAAAILGIERVATEPKDTMDTIILGTRRCLEFASQQPRLKRFLHLSTSEVYGTSAAGLHELSPATIPTDSARWCYATAKLASEFYVKAVIESLGSEFTIVRPFNVYGRFRMGPNAMTTIARRAVANEAIRVSGTGSQTRSWCHIDDFVDGLSFCLFSEAAQNQVFNLGNDEAEISILQLAETIRTIANSSSEIIIDGIIGSDVNSRRPDLRKARELLGYKTSIGIKAGINDVINGL